MELDDFKPAWENIGKQAEKKQNLNLKMFDKMNQKKFHLNLRKITFPEIFGSVICFGSAAFILLSFGKLDTLFLQSVGVLSIVLLLIIPSISIISIQQLRKLGNLNDPYADTLKEFAIQKLNFFKLQKINFTISYLLLVTAIILFSKFFGGRDITDNKYFWTFTISLGYIFLLYYSRWVSKKYTKTIRQAEELLNELAS